MDILISIAEQGFIFGIMALGIYITYKILDFPDLSVDGTFPLGAAISAKIIVSGYNPFLGLVLAFAAGIIAGTITGILHVKLKIKDLLSGILVMLAAYTANYSIVGAPNSFLMGETTIFNFFNIPEHLSKYTTLGIIAVISIGVKFLLDWYLNTKSGFLLKCAGSNSRLIVVLGENPGKVKIIGLALANGLAALAGAVNCQKYMQFDITSGTGTMVMGLAAVIIGTSIFGKFRFIKTTTAVILGMIIYKACITIAFSFGLPSHFMNLMMTILFIIPLAANNFAERRKHTDA